ncbi:winged-helix domain-containing protein [Halorarum salinum]|uniref:ArsR family transcriptional regulator n=1 Tax=Halorarum salinum TaxID=2743089 RepID=A0A7D5LAW2_9EURY|nr:winged-helix domain-containing protein [Halobaculum salinum]QLG62114.1 ArsR family transcriptional regulator [Halobaculum salinum]
MTALSPFHAYDLLVSLVVGIELLYFLRLASPAVEHRRRLLATVVGLVAFVVGGPVAETVLPDAVHWVHGGAALLVVLGLYSPVRDDLRAVERAGRPSNAPDRIRDAADWTTPLDGEILALFDSSELILTPAIVAVNIGYSREEVNRRLRTLESHGLLERVERGKYRLTDRGERCLRGDREATQSTGPAGGN